MPEFVDNDPRSKRGTSLSGGYNINPKLQYVRHSIIASPEFIKGKSILDLGCCVGATGAWALHNGAKTYVGVEIDKDFADLAVENLEKYFHNQDWKILNKSFTDFFESNREKYDVVIAFGVIYYATDIEAFVKNVVSLTNERVIIDCIESPLVVQLKSMNSEIDIDSLPIVELVDFKTVGASSGTGFPVKASMMTMPYLTNMLLKNNFCLENNFTDELTHSLKNEYVNRFCVSFANSKEKYNLTAEEQFKTQKFNNETKWKFDAQVANEFVDYAKHHIPGYERVVKKSVDLCKTLLTPFNNNYRIIDVGCATGYTLTQLSNAGYHNLVGIDSSQSMLDQAKNDGIGNIAYLVNQENFPVNLGLFDVVICNWTLHFIKDKQKYLRDIYQSMKPGAFLILTDKTYNDSENLTMYHEFKKTQGVSLREITEKANSLVDVMFIDPPEWYLETLRTINFKKVSIIDADFCFTTFLAFK